MFFFVMNRNMTMWQEARLTKTGFSYLLHPNSRGTNLKIFVTIATKKNFKNLYKKFYENSVNLATRMTTLIPISTSGRNFHSNKRNLAFTQVQTRPLSYTTTAAPSFPANRDTDGSMRCRNLSLSAAGSRQVVQKKFSPKIS